MTYERLAYDDADTPDHMQQDCAEVAAEMHLIKPTTVATATGLATDVAAGAAQTVKTTVITISDTAAKLASRLLPF